MITQTIGRNRGSTGRSRATAGGVGRPRGPASHLHRPGGAGGEEHHRRDAGQNYRGLGDSITAVFEELPQPAAPSEENYPLKAYQILATLPEREQAKLYTIPAQIRTLF